MKFLTPELEDVLEDIKEYLKDRHDIIDGPNGPLPNTEMALHTSLLRALGELP